MKSNKEFIKNLFLISLFLLTLAFQNGCQNVPIDSDTARAQSEKDILKKDSSQLNLNKPTITKCNLYYYKDFFKLDSIDLKDYIILEKLKLDTTNDFGIIVSMKSYLLFPEKKFVYRYKNIAIEWKDFKFEFDNAWIYSNFDTTKKSIFFDIDSLFKVPNDYTPGGALGIKINDVKDTNFVDNVYLYTGKVVGKQFISNVYISSTPYQKSKRVLEFKISGSFYIASSNETIPLFLPISINLKY
ncbi:MAG: hypothetical protein IPP08_08725 [Chlorobiota bacterium]|nr:hypothetical protein [Chlorobiota bacterium]QQS65855.1 MAG: hypothetical protein IPP08_08725 [Chlorobiota bacterium]